MPMRKEDYHPDWKNISLATRKRAGNECEWCGVPNGVYIIRHTTPTTFKTIYVCGIEKQVPADDYTFTTKALAPTFGGVKIILTVAHLDRNRDNNEPSNLAALCQRCHLNHDRQAQHLPNRKYGRYHDRDHQKKLDL